MHKTLRGRAAKRERKREEESGGGVLFSRRFSGYRVYHHRLSTPRADQSQPAHKGRMEWKLAFLEEMVSPGGAMRGAALSPSLSLFPRHGETCRIKRATSVKKFTPPLCVYAIFLAPSRLTFPLTKRSFVPSFFLSPVSRGRRMAAAAAPTRDALHSIPLSLKVGLVTMRSEKGRERERERDVMVYRILKGTGRDESRREM